jgi:gamma-glutamyltranspeptidase/glutathione hydrolase
MAAVATAAALTFLEPMSTGIGGDAFAIYYEAKTSKLHGVNGSGKSPKATSIELLRRQGLKGSRIPASSIHSITVPGAVAAWCDVVEKWGNGKLTMEQILQ